MNNNNKEERLQLTVPESVFPKVMKIIDGYNIG